MDETRTGNPIAVNGLPHRNLSHALNRGAVQSEVEGGVYLRDLPVGCSLELETCNHRYTLVHQGDGRASICGHPCFCPEPVEVHIRGSVWGGSALKECYLGRGMQLEFDHPTFQRVTTSRIVSIREHRQ